MIKTSYLQTGLPARLDDLWMQYFIATINSPLDEDCLNFPYYGQLPSRASVDEPPLVIVELEKTCYACPAQWEGRLADGRDLYIRFRSGYLSVRADPYDAVDGEEIFWLHYGDSAYGYMETDELLRLIAPVLVMGDGL